MEVRVTRRQVNAEILANAYFWHTPLGATDQRRDDMRWSNVIWALSAGLLCDRCSEKKPWRSIEDLLGWCCFLDCPFSPLPCRSEGPSESECRPYIEKALKELEAGEAVVGSSTELDDSKEDPPTVDVTNDSDHREGDGEKDDTNEDGQESKEHDIATEKKIEPEVRPSLFQKMTSFFQKIFKKTPSKKEEATNESKHFEDKLDDASPERGDQQSVDDSDSKEAEVDDGSKEENASEEKQTDDEGSKEGDSEHVEVGSQENSKEEQDTTEDTKDDESEKISKEDDGDQAAESVEVNLSPEADLYEEQKESIEELTKIDEEIQLAEAPSEQDNSHESVEVENDQDTVDEKENVEDQPQSEETKVNDSQEADSKENIQDDSTDENQENTQEVTDEDIKAESKENQEESKEDQDEHTITKRDVDDESNEEKIETDEDSKEAKDTDSTEGDSKEEIVEATIDDKSDENEDSQKSDEKTDIDNSEPEQGEKSEEDDKSEKDNTDSKEEKMEPVNVDNKDDVGDSKETKEPIDLTELYQREEKAVESNEKDESGEEENAEDAPVEDLSLDTEIPTELRLRDHVEQLLKLDDQSSESESLINRVSEITLRDLKKLYENAIKPLEVVYKYRDLSNRHFGDSEIFSKPLILFMGPWSGGKSSIINYLTNNEYNETSLRTGAEPSPAYFNILMYGEEPEVIDGTELAADFTFSGLQKFGQALEERLRGVKLPSKLLEKVNIVEIPGILEVRKQVSRVFPFNDACQWFIDRGDIIFLVYDPSKLDVGPETEAILDQLKGREHQTRIILNKADRVKPEELMRVQGALIWNISPLMSSPQPPIMYTTSLWSKPYEPWAPIRLLQAQERAFLRDLRGAVDKRIENKIASARRFAVRVRNHAKMVDCYLTTYYNHKSVFGNRKQVADAIIEHPQDYHIYEGLSTLTNISRYDLPDPDVYRDFFKLNPLYEFQQLSATCTYFRGCPINRLDIAIAYDLPELLGTHKKRIESVLAEAAAGSQKKSVPDS
ncbi:unnamed protein product [Phyllotreta striolata]|uniref:Sarcalumenin n=1 Tax=Phyllotreta striolata TaxID=444603 RepID=A0A9N9THA9_PHYSR|nr:unnamed protein product [Phyllotreta striolata]